MSEERTESAREAIEAVIYQYQDVFAARDYDGNEVKMPSLHAWVLLTAHEDVEDPSIGACFQLARRHQWHHETIGMLTVALKDEDDD